MKRLLIALALFVAACTHPVPPNPTPQPPPATTHLESFSVYGPDGPVTSLYAISRGDDGSVYEAASENSFRAAFRVNNTSTGQTHITVWSGDLKPQTKDVNFCASDCEQPSFVLETNAVVLPPLVQRTGTTIGTADGARWTTVENTDFNLLGRLAAGEDIGPILDQRRDIGFDLLRVFTAYNVCPTGDGCQAIGRLVPREHADLYDGLIPRLLDMASTRHLYVEFVGFTGPYGGVLDGDAAKIDHWNRLCAAAQSRRNVSLELVNEYEHPANHDIPMASLQACPGVFGSRGSNPSNDDPVLPVFRPGYGTIHPAPSASGQWQRTYGHIEMEASVHYGVPMVVNEGIRVPEFDSLAPNAAPDICRKVRESAAAAALLGGGSNYHSAQGKNSQLLSGVTLQCAIEFVKGARSIPLTCQDAAYWNNEGAATGDVIREYHRGNDPACTAVIHR